MSLTLTVLGCGNSAGVPTIGNYWGNCDPDEPKNRRTRPGVLIQSAQTTLAVDTGPDFKQQINRENIESIDAVLYTHAHSDHMLGIDDLRVIRHRRKALIPVYGTSDTIEEIKNRFDYLFVQKESIYPQVVDPNIITDDHLFVPLTVGDVTFMPVEQDHGTCRSLAYRFGDLAYSTDVVDFSPRALEALKGIRTWIIDAAGYKMPANKVHLTLKQVFQFNEIVGAERVYLTHLTPAMDYQTLLRELPQGYEPAYDGLKLEIPV